MIPFARWRDRETPSGASAARRAVQRAFQSVHHAHLVTLDIDLEEYARRIDLLRSNTSSSATSRLPLDSSPSRDVPDPARECSRVALEHVEGHAAGPALTPGPAPRPGRHRCARCFRPISAASAGVGSYAMTRALGECAAAR